MKKTKTVLSIVLSLSLLFTLLIPAFATDKSCDCGNAPVVQVRGIGETLYDGEGNEIFSAGNIVNGILPVIPQLAEFLVTGNDDALLSALSKALGSIFGPVAYDSNMNRDTTVQVMGYTSDPVETYMNFENQESAESRMAKIVYDAFGENHSYHFIYDWTANPFDIADDLHEFIQEVKEKSGHDKVQLCGESMGGCMTQTYLSVYGYEDVEAVIMSNAAFNGLEMIGQLFTGEVEIDAENLVNLIVNAINGNAEYASLMEYIPLFSQLVKAVNGIVQGETGARIYKEVLIPYFGYLPSFWAFVPEYSYLEAMDFMLDDAGENMVNFAQDYYNLVASKTTDRVEYMVESDEIRYYCISNYNKYIAPVTTSANWNSDGVIETYNTSGYATVADMNETLGEDYVQAVDTGKNMISPDNVIDASTCQAPYQTWFIKNLGHVQYSSADGTGDMYVWLFESDEQYSIDTDADYPQFMYYNTEIPMLFPYICGSGDVNGDGKVTAWDAKLVLKASVGIYCAPQENFVEADVDCDGKITAQDARIILKKAVG